MKSLKKTLVLLVVLSMILSAVSPVFAFSDAIPEEYEEQAKDMVKSQLVIDKIITDEKIEATEEEVEKRFEEMAKAQNKPVPDVKKYMNARQLDYIKDDIIIKKLFDMLKKENPVG